MNGIAGEQSLAGSKGSEARPEQASPLEHGHVNRVKSILGLDQEHSALSKLAAHTKRKMAELEASKASTSSGAPDWAASMKPEPFGKGFVKANSKQFMISVGIFSLMAFWLCVIRTVHHTDDHSGTSEKAQQIASSAARNDNPPQALPLQQAEVSGNVPANFGSPNASFGSPNPFSGYQQPAVPQVPQTAVLPTLAPQTPASYPQSTSAPQMFSPYPSMYSPPTPGYGTRVPASNFSLQQQPGLIAAQQHTAARYKVVVNR